MNGHINDPKHWRARAEEARILANQMNDSEAKCTLLAGPKTGPWGVYPNAIGGHPHEHRDGAVDRGSDVRDWFWAELVVRQALK